MNYRQVAWWGVAVFLLVVEAIAGIRHDSLLTDEMRKGAMKLLILPAAFGTLGGHFFGQTSYDPKWAFLLIPLGLAVAARDVFVGSEVSYMTHFSVFLLFSAAGALLWGQR